MFEKGHLKLLFRWNQLKWWCKNYNSFGNIRFHWWTMYSTKADLWNAISTWRSISYMYWPALASILLSGYISYFFHLTNWLIDHKEQVKVTKSLLMNISTLDKRNTQIDFNIYTLYIGIWAWHHHDYLVQSVIFLRSQ